MVMACMLTPRTVPGTYSVQMALHTGNTVQPALSSLPRPVPVGTTLLAVPTEDWREKSLIEKRNNVGNTKVVYRNISY